MRIRAGIEGCIRAVVLLVVPAMSQAALVDRGGGMIYDTVLNVTWLQDANYAQTSGHDPDGRMDWANANTWAANLVYGGFDDWRLPTIVDTGAAGCDFAYTGTDCGWNVQTAAGGTVYSELAHLWYVTLGNKAFYDTSRNQPQPGWGFGNKGPFANAQSSLYWSGTEYAPVPSLAWGFGTGLGDQGVGNKSLEANAWAVRSGDVASPVPLPAAAWLLLSGLGGLGLLGRRRAGRTG